MTADEKRAYNIEFAKLNVGRKVRLIRGRFAEEGREGFVIGYECERWDFRTVYGEMGGHRGEPGDRATYLIGGTGMAYFSDPENFVPIDGKGPLIFPATQPSGPPYIAAWQAGGCVQCGKPDRGPGRDFTHRGCWAAMMKSGRCEEFIRACNAADDEAARAMSGPGTPRVKDGDGKVLIEATVSVPLPTLRALHAFLISEVPEPGRSIARERELVRVTRLLGAALNPDAARSGK